MGEKINIVSANIDDMETIFHMRNTAFIVKRSSSLRELEWDKHSLWYTQALEDDKRLMYILTHQDNSIGHLRFDRYSDKFCLITIYLLQEWIGQGFGVEAICLGSKTVFATWPVVGVIAHVRNDNIMGQRGFKKAGFHPENSLDLQLENHITFAFFRD